jgi:Domain of unknown function (DUF4386)
MSSTRKIAITTGVLFIIATAASLVGTTLLPSLTVTDYLTGVSAHTNQATVSALFYLIGAFASVGIAISIYPVIKRSGAGLAVGSVVFRALEAVMYMAGVVSLLSLLTISQQFTTAEAADRTSLQTIGDSFVSVRGHASLLGVFAFCVGAFMYYYLFFRSRLIPRWLSGWGIAGIILMMAACGLALASDNPVTSYVPLALPIGVQELVLAVWLIARGFSGGDSDGDSSRALQQDAPAGHTRVPS